MADNMECENASFGYALMAAKNGYKIWRDGWNGKGLWVRVQFPDQHSEMTHPYLYIEYPADHKTYPGLRCPWLASQTDLMAEDWVVI